MYYYYIRKMVCIICGITSDNTIFILKDINCVYNVCFKCYAYCRSNQYCSTPYSGIFTCNTCLIPLKHHIDYKDKTPIEIKEEFFPESMINVLKPKKIVYRPRAEEIIRRKAKSTPPIIDTDDYELIY